MPGSVPVKRDVHYTNGCDDEVARMCDMRRSASFVPSVKSVMLAIACPVCVSSDMFVYAKVSENIARLECYSVRWLLQRKSDLESPLRCVTYIIVILRNCF